MKLTNPISSGASGGSGATSIFGIRHLQGLLLFLALSLAYALRVNLSVGIVAITEKSAANPNFEEYKWSEKTKSIVLSSFFWGYVITQVPAGYLAARIGAKRILFWSMLMCGILTMLTPLVIPIGGWPLLCVLRVMLGFCQGVVFPSTHTLLSKWAPIPERAQFVTYCYSGAQFGTVVMMSLSGVLASSPMGWPSIFYFSGATALLWAILWMMFGSSSPAECKLISVAERDFIQTSLGHDEQDPEYDAKKHHKTPWVDIFTSLPFISLIIVHSAQNWGFWTLLTEMPSFLEGVLGYDIKKNALVSALPYLAMLFLSFFFSYLSGVLEKRNCVPLKYSRKFFNSIGHWVPMCAFVALGFISSADENLAIALLVIAVGINSSTYLGFQVNHIDIAPNFAGILMGITNCVANIMSIIAPLLVGFIVTEKDNIYEWRIVFFIAAGVYFFGNLMFVLFSSTDIQVWNDPEHRDRQIHANKHRRRSSCLEAQGGFYV